MVERIALRIKAVRIAEISRNVLPSLLGGGALGAAVTLLLANVRPAAEAPLLLALVAVLGAALVIRSRPVGGSPATPAVAMAGVLAVVVSPLLSAFGLTAVESNVVGVVGAVAALVTLVLVQRQIEVAGEQVALAKSEIILVEREVKLVEDDLKYSREQSAFTQKQIQELEKRPHLTVTFPHGEIERAMPRSRGPWIFSADLSVVNHGDRTARDAYIELLIPWHVLQHDLSDEQVLRNPETEIVEGVAHRHFGKQINEPMYRGLERSVTVLAEQLILNPPSFQLRWRLHDDFGFYPQDEPYGRLAVTFPPADSARGKLQFTKRWAADLLPMLAWDRTAGDFFVYVSLAPEAMDEVVIIDQALQTRIEDLVRRMPGLENTTAKTGQIGIEFTVEDKPQPPPSGSWDEGTATGVLEQARQAQARERARHRCFVRSDGGVEVRLPDDHSHPIFQVVRALAGAYAIARVLHHELGSESLARGRFAYKLDLPANAPIGAENDMWIEMQLARDVFVDRVTPIVMELQRAGQTPPVAEETKAAVERLWAPYVERISGLMSS